MLHNLQSPPRKAWIAGLFPLVFLCSPALAANFTLMVTNPDPLGLGSFVPISPTTMIPGIQGELKGQLNYGIGLNSTYDSNFFLTEHHAESEFSIFVTPWVHYSTDPEGGANVFLTANYTPIFRAYTNNTDLNGMDNSGDVTLTMRGSRTELVLFGRYSELSGTDQLTGNFVNGSVFTGGFRATRELAPRTTMIAGWSAAVSDYGSSGNVGSNIYTAYLGGLWQATERLSYGPTLRYTLSESDNTGTRDAWALLFEARYKVGERLWLSASLGPEYATNSGGGSNTINLTGDLSARYVINERWTWVNKIRDATVPSPDQTNYVINNVTVSSSLERQLLRGWLSGGFEYQFSDYSSVGTTGASPGNQQNMNLFLGYGRNLISDRLALNSEIRYAFNDGTTNWSQVMVTLGLNVAF